MMDDNRRVFAAHLAIAFARLEMLRAAISSNDKQDIEFQFDRVLSSLEKLERILEEKQ